MANELKVVDNPDDAEDAEAIVCAPLTKPLVMPDNVVGICTMCGIMVQHRPHIPKNPPLVCYPCILPRMHEERARGELMVTITPKTARELDAYLRKKNAN